MEMKWKMDIFLFIETGISLSTWFICFKPGFDLQISGLNILITEIVQKRPEKFEVYVTFSPF